MARRTLSTPKPKLAKNAPLASSFFEPISATGMLGGAGEWQMSELSMVFPSFGKIQFVALSAGAKFTRVEARAYPNFPHAAPIRYRGKSRYSSLDPNRFGDIYVANSSVLAALEAKQLFIEDGNTKMGPPDRSSSSAVLVRGESHCLIEANLTLDVLLLDFRGDNGTLFSEPNATFFSLQRTQKIADKAFSFLHGFGSVNGAIPAGIIYSHAHEQTNNMHNLVLFDKLLPKVWCRNISRTTLNRKDIEAKAKIMLA